MEEKSNDDNRKTHSWTCEAKRVKQRLCGESGKGETSTRQNQNAENTHSCAHINTHVSVLKHTHTDGADISMINTSYLLQLLYSTRWGRSEDEPWGLCHHAYVMSISNPTKKKREKVSVSLNHPLNTDSHFTSIHLRGGLEGGMGGLGGEKKRKK